MNYAISTTRCRSASEAGPRLASVFISVLMGLAAVTASADPQSRTAELLESVQGVRGIGDVVDKGDGGTGGGGGNEPPPDPEAEAKAFFETEMHPLVYPTCYLSCHQSGGLAGGSDLVLSGPGSNQIAANYTAFKNFITIFGSSSLLLTQISGGNGHPGGVIYSTGSSGYQTIKTWTEFYD